MSIEEQLNEMRQNVANSYVKVKSKGGTLPNDRNLANLPDAIDSISGGGGSPNLGSLYADQNEQYFASDYGYDGFDVVEVNVQGGGGGGATLGQLYADHDGYYNPQDDGFDGYDYVTVDVLQNALSGTDARAIDVRSGRTFMSRMAGGGGQSVDTGTMQDYSGSTTVTPSIQTQTLSTQNTFVTQNITINPMPLSTFSHKTTRSSTYVEPTTWTRKTWNISPQGDNVWTDGTDYYWDEGSGNYIYDKANDTWVGQAWTNRPASVDGANIWCVGGRIFYSSATDQYEIDTSTHTYTTISFTGLTNFDGKYTWFDGTHIHYTYHGSRTTPNSYWFDPSTDTWTADDWTGSDHVPYDGDCICTDGVNIYHFYGSRNLVLDTSTMKWAYASWYSPNTWGYGRTWWSDGVNIYSNINNASYKIDIANETATAKTWNMSIAGEKVFKIYDDIYYCDNVFAFVYKLDKNIASVKATL